MIAASQYLYCKNWYLQRTTRERFALLVLVLASLYLLCLILFIKPQGAQIRIIKSQIANNLEQAQALEQTIKIQLELANKSKSSDTQEETPLQNRQYTFLPNASVLITEILKKQEDLHVNSLKNISEANTPYAMRIELIGSYFATLAYLHRLEKLPWCLSWDSLLYTVTNYPQATVVLDLHVINT